jgi:transposase
MNYHPEALRKRVVRYVEEGRGSVVEASKLYEVSFKSIYNWMRQKKEQGTLKPR